jgi:hypothetical protein
VTAQANHWTRRVARPWRAAFVLYALMLTVATHWPSVALGTEEQPAPDKFLHMLVFGGLVILLWRTGWLKAPWQAVVIVLLWAVVDELSQGLPVLDRSFSWQDVVAGQLGAILVAVGFCALAPVGGRTNRTRIAYRAFIITDLFARARTWLLVGVCAAAGAAVGGLAGWLVLRQADFVYRNPANLIVAAIVAAVAGALVAAAALCRGRAREMGDRQPCFACGGSCREAPFDESGEGRCPSCGGPIHRGQWAAPMQLPMSAALRGAGPAALVAGGLVLAGVALYSVLLVLSMRLTSARQLLQIWQQLSPDMRFCVDLTLVAIALGIGLRIYRDRQARLHDRQHLTCRCCGHDLQGTAVRQGLGVCGECGASFVRMSDQ